MAPDLSMFSLPAKSTRLSLPTLMVSSPSMLFSLINTVTVNIECDLLDCEFISVVAVCRRLTPFCNMLYTSLLFLTTTSDRLGMRTEPFLAESSNIRSGLVSSVESLSRSLSSSLYNSMKLILTEYSQFEIELSMVKRWATLRGITPTLGSFSHEPDMS